MARGRPPERGPLDLRMQLIPGAVVGGKYQLERRLATGGMGSVWAAYYEQLDTRIAIKFMASELVEKPGARGRFEREAKAVAAMRSPHVVQVLEFGVQEDTPYMAMELLQGEDLRDRISERGRLELDEAWFILAQACKALHLAARAGIVHRDLKPSNIFIARSGDDEIVKLVDFGVAKALGEPVGEQTVPGTVLGSPHYMSPEQARGGDLDHRSDLFSMGIILFEMVTGLKPFRGRDLGDILVKICSDPLPSAVEFNPELPDDIDRFFTRALARDPSHRFDSAGDMVREFARIVAQYRGEPEFGFDHSMSGSLGSGSMNVRGPAAGSGYSASGATDSATRTMTGSAGPEPAATSDAAPRRAADTFELDPTLPLPEAELSTLGLEPTVPIVDSRPPPALGEQPGWVETPSLLAAGMADERKRAYRVGAGVALIGVLLVGVLIYSLAALSSGPGDTAAPSAEPAAMQGREPVDGDTLHPAGTGEQAVGDPAASASASAGATSSSESPPEPGRPATRPIAPRKKPRHPVLGI